LPETVRQTAQLADAITLPAVPAMWRAWHAADAIPPNVKLAISAGAPLPLALELEIFAKRGLKIHNFYGASECGGIAYDASETPRTDPACVGSPMKNVELFVADDGCLEVRSRAVAEGWLADGRWEMAMGEMSSPNSQLPAPNSSFRTADLAKISNGRVYLHGRSGDLINVAGRKVSPETIESVLLKHPQVSECLVFGVPSSDAERTEEIVAVIVSREREAALRQFVLETLPAWQAPRHWLFVEGLQTNTRGKLSRAEWRMKFMRRST
jgi:acyl-coenzyme A synthetase/AMP-(fatty) acid ligase